MSNNDRNGHSNDVDVITIFSISLTQSAPYISDDLTTPYQDHSRIIKQSCAGWLLSFRFSNYTMRILCLLFHRVCVHVRLLLFFFNVVDFFLSPNAIKCELLIFRSSFVAPFQWSCLCCSFWAGPCGMCHHYHLPGHIIACGPATSVLRPMSLSCLALCIRIIEAQALFQLL